VSQRRGGVGTGRRYQSSSALDTIEAGNEWSVHIVVVVLLAVEESRGERNDPRDRDGKHLGAGVHVELDLIGV
jgi:hypothetical protein